MSELMSIASDMRDYAESLEEDQLHGNIPDAVDIAIVINSFATSIEREASTDE